MELATANPMRGNDVEKTTPCTSPSNWYKSEHINERKYISKYSMISFKEGVCYFAIRKDVIRYLAFLAMKEIMSLQMLIRETKRHMLALFGLNYI